MNVTTGSGASGWGSVLGVKSGRVSGFGVLGMWKHNTTGSTQCHAPLVRASRPAAA